MNEIHDPELLVLHGLRCIGFASVERIASAVGLDSGIARSILDALSDRDFVSHTPGPFGGWGLTASGRAEAATRIASEIETSGAREVVGCQYEAFLQLNPRLLQVCTEWQMQMVGGVPIVNDHRDPVYDGRVTERLLTIDRAVVPVLVELSESLPRYSFYRPRFDRALEHVEAGDIAYFADHLESYHSVWFQLHEDLLATLGIDRFGT